MFALRRPLVNDHRWIRSAFYDDTQNKGTQNRVPACQRWALLARIKDYTQPAASQEYAGCRFAYFSVGLVDGMSIIRILQGLILGEFVWRLVTGGLV